MNDEEYTEEVGEARKGLLLSIIKLALAELETEDNPGNRLIGLELNYPTFRMRPYAEEQLNETEENCFIHVATGIEATWYKTVSRGFWVSRTPELWELSEILEDVQDVIVSHATR
jgi:hypothetical protein